MSVILPPKLPPQLPSLERRTIKKHTRILDVFVKKHSRGEGFLLKDNMGDVLSYLHTWEVRNVTMVPDLVSAFDDSGLHIEKIAVDARSALFIQSLTTLRNAAIVYRPATEEEERLKDMLLEAVESCCAAWGAEKLSSLSDCSIKMVKTVDALLTLIPKLSPALIEKLQAIPSDKHLKGVFRFARQILRLKQLETTYLSNPEDVEAHRNYHEFTLNLLHRVSVTKQHSELVLSILNSLPTGPVKDAAICVYIPHIEHLIGAKTVAEEALERPLLLEEPFIVHRSLLRIATKDYRVDDVMVHAEAILQLDQAGLTHEYKEALQNAREMLVCIGEHGAAIRLLGIEEYGIEENVLIKEQGKGFFCALADHEGRGAISHLVRHYAGASLDIRLGYVHLLSSKGAYKKAMEFIIAPLYGGDLPFDMEWGATCTALVFENALKNNDFTRAKGVLKVAIEAGIESEIVLEELNFNRVNSESVEIPLFCDVEKINNLIEFLGDEDETGAILWKALLDRQNLLSKEVLDEAFLFCIQCENARGGAVVDFREYEYSDEESEYRFEQGLDTPLTTNTLLSQIAFHYGRLNVREGLERCIERVKEKPDSFHVRPIYQSALTGYAKGEFPHCESVVRTLLSDREHLTRHLVTERFLEEFSKIKDKRCIPFARELTARVPDRSLLMNSYLRDSIQINVGSTSSRDLKALLSVFPDPDEAQRIVFNTLKTERNYADCIHLLNKLDAHEAEEGLRCYIEVFELAYETKGMNIDALYDLIPSDSIKSAIAERIFAE